MRVAALIIEASTGVYLSGDSVPRVQFLTFVSIPSVIHNMHPARFVSLLFIYAGMILILQAGFWYDWQLGLELASQAATGAIILLFPLVRMRQPIEEQRPSQYGPFVYVLVGLCLLLTTLFIVEIVA